MGGGAEKIREEMKQRAQKGKKNEKLLSNLPT